MKCHREICYSSKESETHLKHAVFKSNDPLCKQSFLLSSLEISPAKYILDIDLPTTPLQRCRLTLSLRPPDHVYHAERGRDRLLIRIPVQLPVDGLVGQQHVSPQPARLAGQAGIALAHGLQVGHQCESVRVVDDDVVDVHGEHFEPGPREQRSHISYVCERRDVRGDAASPIKVRQLQGSPELEERIATEHGGEEGAVRLQDLVDLGEDAREIVDPVQGERG